MTFPLTSTPACALLAACAAANAHVVSEQSATTITLRNGLMSITVDRADRTVPVRRPPAPGPS